MYQERGWLPSSFFIGANQAIPNNKAAYFDQVTTIYAGMSRHIHWRLLEKNIKGGASMLNIKYLLNVLTPLLVFFTNKLAARTF